MIQSFQIWMDDDDNEDTFAVEQRTTERHLNDLRTNGYRDARQKYMEDEALMQAGFDSSYAQLVRLGFRLGQVRILGRTSGFDSGFMAALNHRLDAVDAVSFESLVRWSEGSDPDLTPVSDLVRRLDHALGQLLDGKTTAVDLLGQLDAVLPVPGHDHAHTPGLNSLNDKIDAFSLSNK